MCRPRLAPQPASEPAAGSSGATSRSGSTSIGPSRSCSSRSPGTADLVERLATELAGSALTVEGSRGQSVLNPIAAELRQQRDLLGRMLSRLALPADSQDVGTFASILGHRGASARWHTRKGA